MMQLNRLDQDFCNKIDDTVCKHIVEWFQELDAVENRRLTPRPPAMDEEGRREANTIK